MPLSEETTVTERRCERDVRPKTKEDYLALAKERGIEWVGEEVPETISTRTQWICENGHIFENRYNDIRNGRKCPKCSGRHHKTAEDYHAMAKEQGITWIGDELPESTSDKTKWRDKDGEFEYSYKKLRERDNKIKAYPRRVRNQPNTN